MHCNVPKGTQPENGAYKQNTQSKCGLAVCIMQNGSGNMLAICEYKIAAS